MTLAVKVALKPNATNQSKVASGVERIFCGALVKINLRNAWISALTAVIYLKNIEK